MCWQQRTGAHTQPKPNEPTKPANQKLRNAMCSRFVSLVKCVSSEDAHQTFEHWKDDRCKGKKNVENWMPVRYNCFVFDHAIIINPLHSLFLTTVVHDFHRRFFFVFSDTKTKAERFNNSNLLERPIPSSVITFDWEFIFKLSLVHTKILPAKSTLLEAGTHFSLPPRRICFNIISFLFCCFFFDRFDS